MDLCKDHQVLRLAHIVIYKRIGLIEEANRIDKILYFPLTKVLTAYMAIRWQNLAFCLYMGRHILAKSLI
jgi:hypothetical protein